MKEVKSLLIFPALEERFFKKMIDIPADGFIFDLEDGISHLYKEKARKLLGIFLEKYRPDNKLLVIRINSLNTPWGNDDIREVIKFLPDLIMYPKAESPEEIRNLENLINKFKQRITPRILVTLETPKGILNASKILKASSNIYGAVFGTEDLTGAMGVPRKIIPDNPLLYIALIYLSFLASSLDLCLFDGVFPYIGEQYMEDLERETLFAREIGASGKLAVHPSQIETINRVFSVREEELREIAEELETIYKSSREEGLNVILSKDNHLLLSIPAIRYAKKILRYAERDSLFVKKIKRILKEIEL